REFADLIIGLPAVHKTAAASLLVRDAVTAASNAKMKTISYATVMKHVAALRTLTRHAEGAGLSSTEPFYGFRMPRPKTRGGNAKSRLPFTTQDISQIVAALHSTYRSDSADFWVPLIALYQGARLEEICQLEVTDVGVDQGAGVAFLRITDEGAEGKK